jgi:hypothetical protein
MEPKCSKLLIKKVYQPASLKNTVKRTSDSFLKVKKKMILGHNWAQVILNM